MENYKISIDAYVEAKNADEAIRKFRQWISETDASCFEIEDIDDYIV